MKNTKGKRKIEFVYDKSIVLAKIREIADDVQKIVSESKATFFVNENNKDIPIPAEEQMYELHAEISDNVGMYFYKLLNPNPKR